MNENLIDKILTVFVTLVILFVPIYIFYMSWFRSSVYLQQARNTVKDWWPFADFFKQMYSSSLWLWVNRTVSIILLFVTLRVIYLILSGQWFTEP